MSGLILDLFAGAGGWDEGARAASFGGPLVGLEINRSACLAAVKASHDRIQVDVATYPTAPFAGKIDGLTASPPCQPFSRAGTREGLDDSRGQLVWQPLRWVTDLHPRWVACEQVPEVLPIWRLMAAHFRELGYRTWTGVLNSADYGVPQTRLRAVLLARLDAPAAPPEPTHAMEAGDGLFGVRDRWVPMSDVLGWDGAVQMQHRGAGMVERHGERPGRSMDQPSFTITAGNGGSGTRLRWHWPDKPPLNLSVEEAAALQGFRPDFPWTGNKQDRYSQVGNAVCPPFAAAVLAQFVSANAGRAAA